MCPNISKIYSASRATIIKTHLVGILEKKNIDQAWKCLHLKISTMYI
jgi:hypothetical protein